MREVKPFATLDEAQTELDNGGRWLNFFTKAGDEEITWAEFSKAAGTHGAACAALYYALATRDLKDSTLETLEAQFDDTVRDTLRTHTPKIRRTGDVAKAENGDTVLVVGTARPVDERSIQTMTVMAPIMVNNVTTFTPIPVHQQFTVVELDDGSGRCRALYPKQIDTAPTDRAQWAGLIEHAASDSDDRYLRVHYFASASS